MMSASNSDPTTPRDPGPAGPSPGAGSTASGNPSGPSGADTEKLRNILMFLPRFAALLGRLVVDPEVSGMDKALLAAAILYIASPIDIVPDFIPVIGQLDDIYLVALCLLRLLNRSGPAKLRQHWDGPDDIVTLLGTVTDYATRYLPEPVRNKLRDWIEAKVAEGPPPPSSPA